MEITLKSLSHPGLGEIVVRDSLFPIGRHEPPFSGFKNEAVARLSRRHARIFTQDHAVYLIDLDSMNGTTLNGKPLGKDPVPLKQSDKICFAGQLEFLVLAERDDSSESENPVKFILTLVPEKMQAVIEPIVITEFPFLISKSDDLFKRYNSIIPEQYKFLSRRHAHFYVHDDCLMVEDLGSTNGTFLSDRRLDEHAVRLHDGDTIAFGGNDFLYRVHLKTIETKDIRSLDNKELITNALNTSTDLTRTTFVTSASSFIDIFCVKDENEDPAAADDDSSQIPLGKATDKQGDPPPGRVSVFLRELRRSFASDKKDTSRLGFWITLSLLALAFGIIAYSYYTQSDIREIEDLFAAGHFAEAIDRADSFLAKTPDSTEAQEIAIRALNNYVLPTWGRRLDAGEFRAAYQSIEHSRKLASGTPLVNSYFDLLHWITSIEEYYAERGGVDTPITLFKDEHRIRQIIDAWNTRSGEFQKMSSRISQHTSEFNAYHANALSELRALQSEESLYVTAIDELVLKVREVLTNDRLSDFDILITEFSHKYPLIKGLDKLTDDFENYLILHKKVDEQAWLDAIEIVNNTLFMTPPFNEQVDGLRKSTLPPEEIALEYQKAADAWSNGRGDASLSILSTLATSDWGEAATHLISHRKSIWQEYLLINTLPAGKRDSAKILAFYESLDPAHDSFFFQALFSDYKEHQSDALAKAQQLLAEAKAIWGKYLSDGRISGITRLESSVSAAFRQQAARLSNTHEKSSQAIAIYRFLDSEAPERDLQMYDDILRETRLQRRSMQELKMVLESDLYETKISLLPESD